MTRSMSAVVVAAVLVGAGTAEAAPVFFAGEAAAHTDFQTAVSAGGIVLSMESFEEFAAGTLAPFTTTSGITVSGQSSVPDANNDFYETDGNISVTTTVTDAGEFYIEFAFSTPINAFGIDLIDFGTSSAGPQNLTLTTETGSQMVFNNVSFASGGVVFVGVVDTMNTFVSARFDGVLNTGDRMAFDRLQFGQVSEETSGAVPEPGTLGLGIVGMVSLMVVRRGRRGGGG